MGVKLHGWPQWLVEALMQLQYSFPLTPTPFADVAERVGVSEAELLAKLKELSAEGVLRRVGFYPYYKSLGEVAALAAISTPRPREADEVLARLVRVTHSYVRRHERYNLWVVVRGRSLEELASAVERAARESGGGGWVLLPSVRVYRISVKYDLRRGVSRAGPWSTLPPSPPRPEDLGYPRELPRLLRSLPLVGRPYAVLGERLRMGEEEVLEAAKEMLAKGVLCDPGAVLDGGKLGFEVNVMFAAEPRGSCPELCRWVLERVPEATHVVERCSVPESAWRHTCFFVVHAVSRELLEPILGRLAEAPAISIQALESVEDLRPGAERG